MKMKMDVDITYEHADINMRFRTDENTHGLPPVLLSMSVYLNVYTHSYEYMHINSNVSSALPLFVSLYVFVHTCLRVQV